jgi:hypothetical protein
LRSTLHCWIGRYLAGSVAGLADRSHRPVSCPHQASPQVEVLVAELRRKHPRWGSKRIRMQLLRAPVEGIVVPSERTISRILLRHGLAQPRPRKRPKASYVRFERPGQMQLWQIDVVGGLWLVDPVTLDLWLPPTLEASPTAPAVASLGEPTMSGWAGGPVEFDQVVPPSGTCVERRSG